MFKKSINKNVSLIISFIFFYFLFLNISSAADSPALPTFADIGGLILNFNKNIVDNLVILFSGVALAAFLFGLVKFIYDRARGNDQSLARDKKGMAWGLGALFVLVSVWGIIKLVQGILGMQGNNDINLPRICVNGSCDTAKSDKSSQGGGGVFDEKKPDPSILSRDVGEDLGINIGEGDACSAGATTPGFICDTGLGCRDKLTGGPLSSGEGICKKVGLQLNQQCLGGMATESNSCGPGLSCQDEKGVELIGTQKGTCEFASKAVSQTSSKKAPGEVCTVLEGGNSNTECVSGYYCQSSTQKAGSAGKCTALPNSKKAPGEVCTVLEGGNSNTECVSGYYCQSSTQKAGSAGKCVILP